MQSNLGRVALGAVAVVAAVVLLIVLKDDGGGDGGNGDEATPTRQAGSGAGDGTDGDSQPPAIPTIVVKGGKPVGGVQELSFQAGEQIRFRVRSNVADEVHVHGYDVEKALPAGRPISLDFPATIEGAFEAELHESGEQIAELRVEP